MTTPQHIARLLYRHLSGSITPAETVELQQWMNASQDRQLFFKEVNENDELAKDVALLHPERWSEIDAAMWQKIQREITTPVVPVHRVHVLKTAWFRYAAAILIVLGVGTYLYVNNQPEKPAVTKANPLPVQNDVLPGGNKAVLTLADGSKIILDSAANGKIAEQGGAVVIKNAEGKLAYQARGEKGVSVAYNTMTTPRGGQYELTLPDGSRVWLNAESAITYPTAFTGNERKVTITGEAYFEVAHNAKQPFRVETANQTIEVLGTKFNVNAYTDENSITTTLLEGAVRLSADARTSNPPGKTVHTSLILKPGQQGQLSANKLSLAANPDLEQVMAWRNGLFNFNNRSFAEVMQLLARWYDVEIVYEGKIPDTPIRGEMGRDLNLSQVLNALKVMGVNYTIEGKKLRVTN